MNRKKASYSQTSRRSTSRRSLPLVGWIFLIVHAVGSQNLNRRNYARSYFCVYMLAIILIAVLGAMGVLSGLGDVARGTFA